MLPHILVECRRHCGPAGNPQQFLPLQLSGIVRVGQPLRSRRSASEAYLSVHGFGIRVSGPTSPRGEKVGVPRGDHFSRRNAPMMRSLTTGERASYAANEFWCCLALSCLPFPAARAAFHQLRDCPQGFIYVVCGLELASDVWC